jgi:hypothetical protein
MAAALSGCSVLRGIDGFRRWRIVTKDAKRKIELPKTAHPQQVHHFLVGQLCALGREECGGFTPGMRKAPLLFGFGLAFEGNHMRVNLFSPLTLSLTGAKRLTRD